MGKFASNVVKKWQLVLYISLMLGAITFFVSTAITPKYKSDLTILIIQKNADVLTASQNAGYLSDVFEKVLHTESFMRGVLKSDAGIKREFSKDAKKRMEEWKAEIKSEKIGNSGILKISVFDPRSQDSYKIAAGIAKNFKENSTEYFAEKDEVEIKILDGPISSSKVAYPNIKINTAVGLVVGFLGSLLIIYFFEDFDLRLVKKSKRGIALTLRSSEKTIEQKIGDQLVRQLEKRKDNVDLEYLEKQLEQQDKLGIPRDSASRESNITSTTNERVVNKESSADLYNNDELQYIDIPKENDFGKAGGEFVYIEDEQGDEFVERFDDYKKSSKISAPVIRKDIVQIPKEGQESESFWENMRTIDKAAVDSEVLTKDNPLLADSMIDIDRYHEIIKAGETFQGFKGLQAQRKAKEIAEEEVVRIASEDIKKDLERERERDFNDVVEEIEQARQKEQEEEMALDLTKNEARDEEFEELELTAAGLRKIKELQESPQVKMQKQKLEKIVILEKAKEKESEEEIGKVESIEPFGYTEKVLESKELETPEKSKKEEIEKEKDGDLEEDFDEIVEEKREKEKEEIKRLLEAELKEGSEISQKDVKEEVEEIKSVSSDKIVETLKEEIPVKKEDKIEDVESINYIGSADKEDELFSDAKEFQRSVIEGPEDGGALSKLYGKSLFNDKKYKEQQAKRATHHVEMDPEELEMMRKMLEAEGKSEEEFVRENGLVDEKIVQNLKKTKVGQDTELTKETALKIKEQSFVPVKESVKKIQAEEIPQKSGKKGHTPFDLPIFMEEENEQDAFARKLREVKDSEKIAKDPITKNPILKNIDPEKEVSEEEIKEKLNRLLHGEL